MQHVWWRLGQKKSCDHSCPVLGLEKFKNFPENLDSVPLLHFQLGAESITDNSSYSPSGYQSYLLSASFCNAVSFLL